MIVVLAPWFHWRWSKARWLYHWLACMRLVSAKLDWSGHSFEDKFNKALWQACFKTIPGAQVTRESWLRNHAGSAWGSSAIIWWRDNRGAREQCVGRYWEECRSNRDLDKSVEAGAHWQFSLIVFIHSHPSSSPHLYLLHAAQKPVLHLF